MRADVLNALRFGRVLPLSLERKPCVPFAEATRSASVALDLFERFPGAGVGVLTEGRYVVLDVESVAKHGENGFATLDSLEHVYGRIDTRSHRTKSGGLHLICRQPQNAPIRSAQGTLRGAGVAAPGMDIVAGNQVMRWIGTPGYELQADREIEMLPAAWVAALADQPVEHHHERKLEAHGRDRKYAIAALTGEGVEVAQTGAQRNVRLTKAAYKLGRLSPPLEYREVEATLLAACEVNGSLREHGRRACVGTIMRAWRAGSAKPMRLVG